MIVKTSKYQVGSEIIMNVLCNQYLSRKRNQQVSRLTSQSLIIYPRASHMTAIQQVGCNSNGMSLNHPKSTNQGDHLESNKLMSGITGLDISKLPTTIWLP